LKAISASKVAKSSISEVLPIEDKKADLSTAFQAEPPRRGSQEGEALKQGNKILK